MLESASITTAGHQLAARLDPGHPWAALCADGDRRSDGLQDAQPSTMDIALQEVGGTGCGDRRTPSLDDQDDGQLTEALPKIGSTTTDARGRQLRIAVVPSRRCPTPRRMGSHPVRVRLKVTAYAVGRSSSHRSTSRRRQPTARDPRPPSLTGCGKSPERLRRHNEVRDRPVNSRTVRVRKITG